MEKRKNDEQYALGEDGELELVREYIDIPANIKRLAFFPMMIFIGVTTLFTGFFLGAVIQAQADRYVPDTGMKNIILGCYASFNTDNPDYKDLISTYYSSSKITDSVIPCITHAAVEGYDPQSLQTLPINTVRLSMIGCLGNSVSGSEFSSTTDRNQFFDCLVKNNIHFRVTGIHNALTPEPTFTPLPEATSVKS